MRVALLTHTGHNLTIHESAVFSYVTQKHRILPFKSNALDACRWHTRRFCEGAYVLFFPRQ